MRHPLVNLSVFVIVGSVAFSIFHYDKRSLVYVEASVRAGEFEVEARSAAEALRQRGYQPGVVAVTAENMTTDDRAAWVRYNVAADNANGYRSLAESNAGFIETQGRELRALRPLRRMLRLRAVFSGKRARESRKMIAWVDDRVITLRR